MFKQEVREIGIYKSEDAWTLNLTKLRSVCVCRGGGRGGQAINELVGSAGGAMFGLIVHFGIVEWIV